MVYNPWWSGPHTPSGDLIGLLIGHNTDTVRDTLLIIWRRDCGHSRRWVDLELGVETNKQEHTRV
jgi:hypothetical protein